MTMQSKIGTLGRNTMKHVRQVFHFALPMSLTLSAALISPKALALAPSKTESQISSQVKAINASHDETLYWMKVRALDTFERSMVSFTGASVELVREDYVIAYGNKKEKEKIEKMGRLIASSPVTNLSDFPPQDAVYHNYAEITAEVRKLAAENPNIIEWTSIGKTHEGRDIWCLRISTNLATSRNKPGVIFMGGHHAREHLSIDTPLRIFINFINAYKQGDARIRHLIESREIHFIPVVNPDGAEYDITNDTYHMWRKNRRVNEDGTYGVDLNRNYGFMWGVGGSSRSPDSDTYMGPAPFSEPETQAIKNYVDAHSNITVLLSFHTFSELVLYPWGHKVDPIAKENDRRVFETMAQTMAHWNGYTPQQSSALYVASGDTTDWAYGTHNIFAFTFELDPKDMWSGGGFYPGAGVIDSVVQKNTEPVLYLMEVADNPYRVLNAKYPYGYQ